MTDQEPFLRQMEASLLADWQAKIAASGTRIAAEFSQAEQQRHARLILTGLLDAIQDGNASDVDSPAFAPVRRTLAELAANFAERGMTPSETATFVFSLKEAVFQFYQREFHGPDLATKSWEVGSLIDQLGLYAIDTYAQARERLIKSQAKAIAELSTPVIQVWAGILAVPLVGAVDSARAKEIMERLLAAVIELQAEVVIIDITGVPVVDSQVADRLLRTVESVRLLGTKAVVTGINAIVAQTLVQLGADLDGLDTRASMRSGLEYAFRERQLKVVARGRS